MGCDKPGNQINAEFRSLLKSEHKIYSDMDYPKFTGAESRITVPKVTKNISKGEALLIDYGRDFQTTCECESHLVEKESEIQEPQ